MDNRPELNKDNVDTNPFTQFHNWYKEAENHPSITMPEAMAIATSNADGQPAVRMVLLKDYGEHGFIFYTNYEGRKASDLAQNPQAALLFYWEVLGRQIRIEGRVQKVSLEISDAYFKSRPHGSQIGAWASNQSEIIENRQILEDKIAQVAAQYEGEEISRPPHWGGYCLTPSFIEFWQERPYRLHDRIRFRKDDQNQWIIERLSP